MNERIRKIAEDCVHEHNHPSTLEEVNNEYFDLERFAELIVLECADLCLKYAKHEGPFNTMEFRKGQHFNTIIKDHFGVDE